MSLNNEQSMQGDPKPVGGKLFQIHQKLLSIGNDYTIENEQGETVYKVDGKVGWHKKFIFENAEGKTLAMMKKHLVTIRETIEVTGAKGEPLAVVKKALITPLREHFTVSVQNGPDLDIHGDLIDHEYTIDDGQNKVATVTKKMLHVRDSYSVQIKAGQDEVIILGIVVCIDEMTHSGN